LSKSLNEYGTTREFEESIREIVHAEISRNRPACRYAVVEQINYATRSCFVTFNGDVTMSKVYYRSIAPSAVGQVVAIEGTGTDQYIADVLGPSQNDVNLAALSQTTTGTIDWLTPTLASGATAHAANPPKYRKVTMWGTDFIQLRGRINVTAAVSTLWTFPTGYRPLVNLAPVLVARDEAGGSNTAQIECLATGVMRLIGKTAGANSGSTDTVDPVDTTTTAGRHRHWEYNSNGPAPDPGFTDWNGDHSHGVTGGHAHTVPSVVAPTFISLDGVQYAL